MTQDAVELDVNHCRSRQQRVQDVMADRNVDRVLLVSPENVQYLTGFRPHRLMSAAVSLDADGWCALAAPNTTPEPVAADDVVTFEAQWHSTLRQEQPASAAIALAGALANRPPAQVVAVECSRCGPQWLDEMGVTDISTLIDIEPELWQLRRRKDADELAMIRRAIACTDAMYLAAREIIRPGITELEVFNRLHAAAVDVAGEPLTALGNDFRCNSPGGPPRTRAAQAGELFILDLGPAYRGYYADNCRTFAVNRQPTDQQQAAWEKIVGVLQMVEESVRPGVSCRQLFEQAQAMLDEYRREAFFHHLGHGFGLFPHEAPHLNPDWDDTFEEGDVFTAEPGLYGDELLAGIRLEQDYRVTADGVERLTSFPLDL
jgi:Xaa-Pro aminopeptidase